MPTAKLFLHADVSRKPGKDMPRKRTQEASGGLPPVTFDADYPRDQTMALVRKLRVPPLKKLTKSLF